MSSSVEKKKVIVWFIFSILIFFACFSFLSEKNLFSSIQQANLAYVFVALICDIGVIYFLSMRWRYILKSLEISLPSFKAYEIIAGSVAINNMIPSGRVIGDLLRPFFVNKINGTKKRKTYATVMLDKSFDFGFAFLFGTLFLLILAMGNKVSYLMSGFSLIFVLLIFGVFIYLDRLESVIINLTSEKHKEKITDFFKHTKKAFEKKSIVIAACLCTLLSILFLSLRAWFIFKAINVPVPLFIACELIILESILSAIPITPGGVGFVEGGIYYAAQLLGIPAEIAPVYTILNRLISYWFRIICGSILLYHLGFNWSWENE